MMKMILIQEKNNQNQMKKKKLISIFQRNPTLENFLTLRNIVINSYNKVLVKKENKLSELRIQTKESQEEKKRWQKWKKQFKICILIIGIE